MKQSLLSAQSPEAETRKKGEKEIRTFRDADTKKFMGTLTREIADENLDAGSR